MFHDGNRGVRTDYCEATLDTTTLRHTWAYRTHDTVPATGFALDLGGGSNTADIVLNNLAVSEP